MSNELVVPVKSGVRVLGVDQYEFTVDGVSGRTLTQAVGYSNIRRAVSIEEGTRAYTVMIRARQKKCEELSELMSIIVGTYAAYEIDDPEDRTYTYERYTLTDYTTFKKLIKKYEIPTHGWTDSDKNKHKISAGQLDQIRTEVEHLTNKETTQMQEEMTLLQYYLNKRDSAYSTASQMMSKVNTSISASIAYILG